MANAIKAVKQQSDCLFLWPDPRLFPPDALALFLKDAIQKGVPVVGPPSRVRELEAWLRPTRRGTGPLYIGLYGTD